MRASKPAASMAAMTLSFGRRLRLLAVDGVTPGNDTIADESYPLCNEFYAVVHADAAPDSPQRKVYDWLDTDEGRRCIEKAGYVAVD